MLDVLLVLLFIVCAAYACFAVNVLCLFIFGRLGNTAFFGGLTGATGYCANHYQSYILAMFCVGLFTITLLEAVNYIHNE